jgi:hypothetical protein
MIASLKTSFKKTHTINMTSCYLSFPEELVLFFFLLV